MATREGIDVVYGVHDFDAENPDELSFKAGERIIVFEKDDQYQDGWWQGENSKGEHGLFPQTYTQSTPLDPTSMATTTPIVGQNGFAADSKQPESPRSASPQRRGGNRSPDQSIPREETPEMRATIDDIQSHLDGMYKGQQTSHHVGLPGTLAPGIETEQVPSNAREAAPVASVPQSDTLADDSSSIVSGASSVLGKDVEEGDTAAQGEVMASHAKENLARNIQLAKEKEDQQRLMVERQREAERERMRLSAQPVEGLVFSDESDAESAVDDDDDDSIFPSRRETAEESTPYHYEPVSQASANHDLPAPEVGSKGQRFSTSTAVAVPLPETGVTTPQEPLSRESLERDIAPEAPLSPSAGPDPYLMSHPPSLVHHDSDAPSNYQQTPSQVTPVHSPALPTTALAKQPSADDNDSRSADEASSGQQAPYERQPIGHPGELPLQETAPQPNYINRSVTPVQMEASPISAVTQPIRTNGGRRSIDAGVAPGQAGLIALVQQATIQPSQAVASQRSPSPHPSTTGSSRPSSTLGTAFTPATTSNYYDQSPRSGTFGHRQNVNGDPRDWNVEQVVEWGQARNFDSNVLGKFREHEISGDVLLDMDINTLKEIDIIAFGPRARIAKAIKELKMQVDPSQSLSPSVSGYETGSPSTMGLSPAPASLQEGNFTPSSSLPTTFETPVASSEAPQSSPVAQSGSGGNSLRGLGFEQGSPRLSQDTAPPKSPATSTQTSEALPTGTPKSTRTRHTTGGTADSFETADDAREELTSNAPTDSTESAPKTGRRQKSSLGSSFRMSGRQSSQAGTALTEPDLEGESKDKVGKSAGRSFFGNTLGRSRKPPPQYQGEQSTTAPPIQRSPSSAPSGNRLSTRLFAFGGNTSPQAPVASNHEKGKRSISAPLEAAEPGGPATPPISNTPSSTNTASPLGAAATSAPTSPPAARLSGRQAGPVEKIGQADYSGWLRKRSDRYNSWKERYLILKGVYLYVLKSPTEDKIKGQINLTGYKFVSDGSVGSGLGEKARYGFKALHDTQPTHYFSSGDTLTTRNWMKALMKATIGRDYTAPVTSSSNIKTIPLSVAQSMNPPPRPPSPTSAARMQKASLATNPNTLTAQDAAKLMGASVLSSSSTGMERGASMTSNGKSPPVSPAKRKNSSFLPPLKSSARKKPVSEDFSDPKRSPTMAFVGAQERPSSTLGKSERRLSWYGRSSSEAQPSTTTTSPKASSLSPNAGLPPSPRRPSAASAFTVNPAQELLDWVNDHLPQGTAKAFEWSDLSSGRIYTRLVEHLGGKKSGIDDSQFEKFRPLQPGRTPDMDYIDILFRCFDFLLDRGVKTEDVSINDLMTGNQPHLIKLADIIRTRFEN